MHKLRLIFCFLLVAAMIYSISACDRTSSDEGDKESNAPAETGGEASTAPPSETPDETSPATSIPPHPYEGRSDLVILNWEEYVSRPHGIQPGTILNYAIPREAPSQVPWNSVSEGWLTGNIYEGLLYMYINDPTDIRSCIAENWEHSDDYLTWTFQIRDGVKFHDGTACDATAVANSWDFYNMASPASFSNLNMVSWEAASARELVITLSAPCAYFEVALTRLYIVSPTALKQYGINENDAAVGTGPYHIDSYTSGVSIVLKATPDYYLREKIPCIETVNFKVFREQEDILIALISGDVDGANIESFRSNYFINSHYVNSCQYLQEKGYGGNLITCFGRDSPMWLNAIKVEAFQTKEVREAICRFIDFSAINEQLYSGLGCVQDSLWAKGSSGYVPTDQYYYDPYEGRELLASVGIEPSDIKCKDYYSDYNRDMYLAIQNELMKAGVTMDIEGIHPEWSFTPSLRGDWSILFFSSIGYSSVAPYVPWKLTLKSDAPIKLCFQDTYDSDLYGEMLEEYDQMIKATTWEAMLTHCRLLTTYVQDDFGAIGGVQPPAFLALSKDFKNGIYFSESHDIQLYYMYK